VKVKLFLYLIKHHAMNTCWEVQLDTFLTSVLNRGERSTSRPSRITTEKKPPVPTNKEERKLGVCPRGGLGAVAKREVLAPDG